MRTDRISLAIQAQSRQSTQQQKVDKRADHGLFTTASGPVERRRPAGQHLTPGCWAGQCNVGRCCSSSCGQPSSKPKPVAGRTGQGLGIEGGHDSELTIATAHSDIPSTQYPSQPINPNSERTVCAAAEGRQTCRPGPLYHSKWCDDGPAGGRAAPHAWMLGQSVQRRPTLQFQVVVSQASNRNQGLAEQAKSKTRLRSGAGLSGTAQVNVA